MSVQYDPAIIQQMADSLYRRAGFITVVATLIGALCGAGFLLLGVPFFLRSALDIRGADPTGMLCPASIAGFLGGGLLGYNEGMRRSFHLRFQAQSALCQKAIEDHLKALRAAKKIDS